MKKSKLLLYWLPVVIMMAVIFAFSHQSAEGSQNLSDSLLTNIFNVTDITIIISLVFRKFAHISEYTLLSFLSANAFRNSGERLWAISSVILTLFYACTDEVHQRFIPGRTGRTYDVFIDLSGAVIGILIYWLIIRYRSNKHGKNQTV